MNIQETHHKHPPLTRRNIGNYHRCEWSIYGSTCTIIKELFQSIETSLSPQYKLAYVDADHGIQSMITNHQIGKKHLFLNSEVAWNEYDDKTSVPLCDAVIVNGNHFPASRQIVIIDSSKKDSLKRRIDQLNTVEMVLLMNPQERIYDFLKDKVSPEIPIHPISDIEKIRKHIERGIATSIPPLKALILAGGKSKRMGDDKSQITYHKKPQQVHIADVCYSLGLEVYISKSYNYEEEAIDEYQVIKDRMIDMGPFGAIISAMMHDPDSAWMVIACDLPYLEKNLLQKLITNRSPSVFATTIKSIHKNFPEPLITIYEPSAYNRLLKFMALGYSCPRKVLINSEIKVLELDDDGIIDNVNTPEERSAAFSSINNQ